MYGTLRRGAEDHRLLRGAVFVAEVRTAHRYRLADANGDGYLDLLDIGDESVPGELYEAPESVLQRLDREELPIYRREPVVLSDGTTADAYAVHVEAADAEPKSGRGGSLAAWVGSTVR